MQIATQQLLQELKKAQEESKREQEEYKRTLEQSRKMLMDLKIMVEHLAGKRTAHRGDHQSLRTSRSRSDVVPQINEPVWPDQAHTIPSRYVHISLLCLRTANFQPQGSISCYRRHHAWCNLSHLSNPSNPYLKAITCRGHKKTLSNASCVAEFMLQMTAAIVHTEQRE